MRLGSMMLPNTVLMPRYTIPTPKADPGPYMTSASRIAGKEAMTEPMVGM